LAPKTDYRFAQNGAGASTTTINFNGETKAHTWNATGGTITFTHPFATLDALGPNEFALIVPPGVSVNGTKQEVSAVNGGAAVTLLVPVAPGKQIGTVTAGTAAVTTGDNKMGVATYTFTMPTSNTTVTIPVTDFTRPRVANATDFARNRGGNAYASDSSTQYNPTAVVANCFDGSNDTHHQFGGPNDPKWIAVNLGEVRTIGTVYIRWATDGDNVGDALEFYYIQVATGLNYTDNDALHNSNLWQTVAEVTTTQRGGVNVAEIMFSSEVQGQWVRILRKPGVSWNTWARCALFQVYAAGAAEGLDVATGAIYK
jgi:hypothetical protein